MCRRYATCSSLFQQISNNRRIPLECLADIANKGRMVCVPWVHLHPLVCPVNHKSFKILKYGLQYTGVTFLDCFRMLVREVFLCLLNLLFRQSL